MNRKREIEGRKGEQWEMLQRKGRKRQRKKVGISRVRKTVHSAYQGRSR